MLPRSQSIFHLGEEGGAQCHRGSLVGAAMVGGGGRRLRERLVVGLQILVHHQHGGGHHHHHHGRHAHAHAANIVLKQMVRPPQRAAVAAGRHGAASCSFLEACSLCRRELSPNKDVYMYRGDQGFCSEECRWQQILVDEAREREAISKARHGLPAHRRSPHHTPIRGRPRKTLAVA